VPPPQQVELGALSPVVGAKELSAVVGYTTTRRGLRLLLTGEQPDLIRQGDQEDAAAQEQRVSLLEFGR